MLVYSSGEGMVLKGICRQIKASVTKIAIHGDAMFAFVWTRHYASSRFFLYGYALKAI